MSKINALKIIEIKDILLKILKCHDVITTFCLKKEKTIFLTNQIIKRNMRIYIFFIFIQNKSIIQLTSFHIFTIQLEL